MLYFSDLEETSFAIFEENESKTKKILLFMSDVYGKDFEEVSGDDLDDYIFETDTLVIESKYFTEDILELTEMGVEIHII
jgi:hypothetical protein